MTVDFRILGPLEVVRDGGRVPLGGPRQRALLALLLTRANTTVARDRLIDELWGDEPPESAVNVLYTYISHLRQELPDGRLLTRPPGYLLEVRADELDLHRFETLAAEGRRLQTAGDREAAAGAFREALALWRGPALGNVAESSYARAEAIRLEELRLAVLEERIDADLASGRHGDVVGELEALVVEHPLRERLRGQLMLALYRSGRQSEALAVYRGTRETLVTQLGIEPGHALRELEAAILRQDSSLEWSRTATAPDARGRSLVVVSLDDGDLDALVAVAEPLVRRPQHGLVLVRLVSDASALGPAARLVNERRNALGDQTPPARATAFTSSDPAADVVRLARAPDVALLLLGVAGSLSADGRIDARSATVLRDVPCDVGLLANAERSPTLGADAPVVVPFGGAEHEWAAAEIGAWIASVEGRRIVFVGTAADPEAGRRDASRLLASVALLVQQVAGVETEPALVTPGAEGVIDAAEGARVVLVGLPDDWRSGGVGRARAEVARRAPAPVIFIRGGLRPSGFAPAQSVTRFTWTLGDQAS